MKFTLCFFILIFSAMAQENRENDERINAITNLKRISFGSCNGQNHEQPLWHEISQSMPDLFIWGGDNVYAETQDPNLIKTAFNIQNQNPNYQAFKSLFPIIGIWDDHDFAYDNATGSFPYKQQSQKHFLDFMQEPSESKRRSQEGIYTSYEFFSEGNLVKIILLDNRYFKGLQSSAPLLGETQWAWIENEFKSSKAHLHFIVGGLSILSPKLPKTEEWEDHPLELNRMLSLISKHKLKAPIFLTGDKHFASIFERRGHLEFMSSGLTHTAPRITWSYLRSRYPNTYFGLNYGLIDIDWDDQTPMVRMSIRDRKSKVIHYKTYRWSTNRWVKDQSNLIVEKLKN